MPFISLCLHLPNTHLGQNSAASSSVLLHAHDDSSLLYLKQIYGVMMKLLDSAKTHSK